jgi:hypothetical protein
MPPPNFIKGYLLALSRFYKYIQFIINEKVDFVLIFTTSGFGYIEKGSMVLVANLLKKPVIFSPARSKKGDIS